MGTFWDFLQALGNKESSGNYGAINQLNYLGKYQMSEVALIDAGYYTADGTKKNDWSGTWAGKDGVNSWQDFINSPQAQENAILDYTDKQWGYIKHYGMDKYIGQTINGVLITESGLIAAAHLGGIGHLIKYLKSDGKNDFKDDNETSISSYMKDFAGYDLMMNERICPAEPLPWYYTVYDVYKGLFDFFGSISDSLSRYFTRATQWVWPRRDPLTLDLDGDGIETVGINTNNPILFDHDADGVKTATGWIKGDDGLLVLDRNGNGTIDSGKELFGDSTQLSAGGNAADGFAALADLNSNGDGVIDGADAQFANLKVWRDLNQDGVSQSNELSTLSELGIASISLTKKENNQLLPDGNTLMDLGTYTKTDGLVHTFGATSQLYNPTGQTGDVDLTENTFYSDFIDTIPITPEAELLPNMEGSGLVRDLREAASIRGDLANVLKSYASATTKAEQMALMDQLLLEWSKTSDMSDIKKRALDAGYVAGFIFGNTARDKYAGLNDIPVVSTGGYSSDMTPAEAREWMDAYYNQNQDETYWMWMNRLAILEKFNGRTFFDFTPLAQRSSAQINLISADTTGSGGSGGITVPFYRTVIVFSQPQIDLLSQGYEVLRQSVYEGLFLQTRGKAYLDAIGLTIESLTLR